MMCADNLNRRRNGAYKMPKGFHFHFGGAGKTQTQKQPQEGKARFNPFIRTLINIIVTFIVGALYFYINLPALNLHSIDFYFFIGLLCVIYSISALISSGFQLTGGAKEYGQFVKQQCKIPLTIVIALLAVFIVGTVSSVTYSVPIPIKI
jgi:fluoride ion exporter CrcB/FEX